MSEENATNEVAEEPASGRLMSLDAFRGFTVAGMILVNNPGDWGAVYPPLLHAPWHGLTPTDLVFPFFLFIVGVSIALALGKRIKQGIDRQVYLKVLRRSGILFLAGLFLNAFPFFDFANLRIPGVLQRIAICYLIVSLLFLRFKPLQLAWIGTILLIIYWMLMTLVPVPGCAIPDIGDKACNLAAYLDRSILGANHIWSLGKVYDPEGILSTIPAIVTTITGVLAGVILKTKQSITGKLSDLFAAGVGFMLVGWIWSFWLPLNKALWTGSYVFVTSGIAFCTLALSAWLIDLKSIKAWAKPLVVFGTNAFALYIGAELLSKVLSTVKLGEDESLKSIIFEGAFLPMASPMTASLLYAISFILLWLLLMWLLYRKEIYIKV